MSDEQIIALYWERSETAISETAAVYGNYCHKIAMNILSNSEDADECVNDTYARVWNAIPPQRPNKLSAFLGRITRNLALNVWEKRQAEKRGGGQFEIVLSELEEVLSDDDLSVERHIEVVSVTEASTAFSSRRPTQTGCYSFADTGTQTTWRKSQPTSECPLAKRNLSSFV